ncbi:MAG: peptidoglycan DD-metalloendopeptidase family protein [Bacillota bacterium]|nr:peptidoglycan DD-metalloendopeptidase family protein [Bacillota bacterium]
MPIDYKNDIQEAQVIKPPKRGPEHAGLSRKMKQRIISLVAVLLCIGFVAGAGGQYVSANSMAYVIKVNGEELATLVSEEEAQQAIDKCLAQRAEQYQDRYGMEVSFGDEVTIDRVLPGGVIYSSVDQVVALLNDNVEMVAEAVAVYIDGKTRFYMASQVAAQEAVQQAKYYFGNPNSEDGIGNIYTDEEIALVSVEVDCNKVLTIEEAKNMLLYNSKTPLAEIDPIITVNVERESKETIPLPYGTEKIEDSEMLRGKEEVVSEGIDGVQEVTNVVTEKNGVVTSSTQKDSVVIVEPVDEVVKVGTMIQIASRGDGGGSGFIGWPTSGTLTSRFGVRARGWHSGIDIANAIGTSVFAAEAGTVTFVDYMSGYGLMVIIDHGGGVETYYAHLSVTNVEVGDVVERSQGIAAIGMTGTTTGPHLHFEIRFEGLAVDPLSYLE